MRSGDSTTARIERTADGKIEFVFDGTPSTKVQWYVPIHSRIATEFEVQFDLEAHNIKQRELNPNIYFRLERRRESPKVNLNAPERADFIDDNQAQMVPIYTSAGQRDSALGRISLDTRDFTQTIDGLYIDLALSTDGEGRLRVSTLRVLYSENRIHDDEIAQILSTPPPIQAEVVATAGLKPALAVNGTIESGLIYAEHSDSSKISPTRLRECGISTRRIVLNFGGENSFFPNHPPLWIHEDFINFSELDHLLGREVLGPGGFAIIDMLLSSPPPWWPKKHLKNSGTAEGSDDDNKWSAYCESAINQLFAFIRKRPYAERIIGCNIINGYGMNDYTYPERDQFPEYVTAFRTWLSEQYETEKTLKDAWNDSNVDFGNAVPLPAKDWMRGSIYSFVHPKSGLAAFDSYRFHFINWANNLIHLSRLIKKLSHNHYITGIIGGPGLYLNSLWNNGYRQNGEAFDRILESEYVDTIEIPVDLSDVRTGDGTAGAEYILSDKISRSGKILIARNGFSLQPRPSRGTVPFFSRREIIEIQRRIFVANLINNGYMTIAGIDSDILNEDGVVSELKSYNEIRRKASKLTDTGENKVAFVIAPETFQYLAPVTEGRTATAPQGAKDSQPESDDIHFLSSPASPYFNLYELPRKTWNRIGTSFDVVSIEDLEPESYKVLILFHILKINKRRQEIIDRAKTGGRTLVSIWANGFVSERYLSPVGMQKITGMKIKTTPGKTRFHLAPRKAMQNFLKRAVTPSGMGWLYVHRNPVRNIELQFGPIFTVEDETATILASYTDGGGAAMAVKNFPEWTSFYSASPILNPEILRILAKQKEVHIYLDTNDLCYINDMFIGIHSLDEGVREIKLPTDSSLYEVFRDQELEKNRNHHIELEAHTTYLFFRGDRNTWISL